VGAGNIVLESGTVVKIRSFRKKVLYGRIHAFEVKHGLAPDEER
jgi:hypothetical protein